MPPPLDNVKAVFLNALDKTDPNERSAYLNEACAGDVSLRQHVQEMLQLHDQADPVLDQVAADFMNVELLGADEAEPQGEQPGNILAGRYKLLERIGEGGMGTVWLAEQTQPVRRRVAIKLIKPGMDTRAVLARFDAERQALAMMEHPNIAKVLDGGTTEAGRPFFVMEYVKGVPITQYCDEARLSVDERLALFVHVCQAVQHAHQKGIIHRDLKPNNVLVCRYEGVPVPKVIDFGLAKALKEQLTEQTLFTAHGVVMGTPLYMSPEQAEFNNLDIDTRSDIYALGVILYELLTGTTPLEKSLFQIAAVQEMFRLIKEEEPPPPSARLKESGSLPSVAAQRQVEPLKLTRLLRGELDWIVMKCLEKDRARRYDSAGSFAADINHYLSGEQVSAHPPSRSYRLRKFLRRHRGQVIAASLVVLALVAGIFATTLGLIEARRQEGIARQHEQNAREQERIARQERDDKEAARKAEAEQRQVAETRLRQLEKGVDILASIFKELNPTEELLGGDSLRVSLGKQLERATQELKAGAFADPLVVAKLQDKLGAALHGLGYYGKAVNLLEQVAASYTAHLGDDHGTTLEARQNLGAAYLAAGQTRRAVDLFARNVPLLCAQVGKNSPVALRARSQYANALVAAQQFDTATEQLTAVVDDFQASGLANTRSGFIAVNMLAHVHMRADRSAMAIPLLEKILPECDAVLGADHPDTLIIRNNLAMALKNTGAAARAVPLLRRTCETFVAKLGEEHPTTLTARYNLVQAMSAAGDVREAVPILERLLKIHETKDGPRHTATLTIANDLGVAYRELRQLDKAIPLLERALAARKANRPDNDGDHFATVQGNLAMAYAMTGQHDKAVALVEQLVTLAEKKADTKPATFIMRRNKLVDVLYLAGQLDRALRLAEVNLADAEAKLGMDSQETLRCRSNLAITYRRTGQSARALPLLERNVPLSVAKLGPDHPHTVIYRANLALAQHDAGNLTAALSALEAAVQQGRRVFGPDHPETLDFVQSWCDALVDAKDVERALKERLDVVTIERRRGKDDPRLAAALTMLGKTLTASGRPAEAEPPLREALAIRQKVEPDLWTTFSTQSLLGDALLAQKKPANAEPLLRAGYDGMKQRLAKIPPYQRPRVTEALRRLVALCEALGKPDEAAAWRKELEKVKVP